MRAVEVTTGNKVPDEAMFDACNTHNVALLRLWGRHQGVRLRTGDALSYCACIGAPLGVIRCLVNDLGADVNQSDTDGVPLLHWAAKKRKFDVMRCLVKDFGANANQAIDNDCMRALAYVAS